MAFVLLLLSLLANSVSHTRVLFTPFQLPHITDTAIRAPTRLQLIPLPTPPPLPRLQLPKLLLNHLILLPRHLPAKHLILEQMHTHLLHSLH